MPNYVMVGTDVRKMSFSRILHRRLELGGWNKCNAIFRSNRVKAVFRFYTENHESMFVERTQNDMRKVITAQVPHLSYKNVDPSLERSS